MALQITQGIKKRAQRVLVYGVEGIGKSTFAAQFPKPLFIDTEGSTDHMDVARTQTPSSWVMLIDMLKKFTKDHQGFQTLVIDTIDWAEKLCIRHMCKKNHKDSIEDFGYGSGYIHLLEEMGLFLNVVDEVIESGANVVFTAHAQIRKFEQPDEMGSYDRYELKLGQKTTAKTAALIKEWADAVLFINYKNSIVTTNSGKTKATQGQRVMYTTHTPQWDAKNRYDLKPELPFEYESIAFAIDGNTETQEKGVKSAINYGGIPNALKDLMERDNITLLDIKKVVADKGHYPRVTDVQDYDPDFIDGWIIPNWDKLVKYIQKNN